MPDERDQEIAAGCPRHAIHYAMRRVGGSRGVLFSDLRGHCLRRFGCPALVRRDNRVTIDRRLCVDCGVCVQVCGRGAIETKR